MKNFLKITIYSSKRALITTALLSGLALLTSFSPAFAQESTIFEGYYKVLLSNVHAGYAVQRYTFNAQKKQFKSIYYVYVRLSPDGKKYTTESLTALSNEKFHPVSYQYTAISDGKPIAIDGQVKNDILVANINKGGKSTTSKVKVPKGAFFSTMLLHLVLQNGLKVGKSFSFNAVAEEDAKVLGGTLSVTTEQKIKGVNTHKLEYDYKNVKSEAYVSDEGHVLSSDAPAQGVSTVLVAEASEARGNFPFPEKTLKTLFGSVPSGKENTIAKLKSSKNTKLAPPTSPTDTLRTGKSGN